MSDVVVIGAGAWGTALAIQAGRAGDAVTLCDRDPAVAGTMARDRRTRRLPGARLPESVTVVGGAPPAAAIALVAVPMAGLAAVRADAEIIVACCKGVDHSGRLPLEVLAEAHPGAKLAVLSGPNFAAEVAAGLPAASVVAASDKAVRARVIAAVRTPAFRLYGNADPIGAQVCGAAKNVVAIAAGVAMGARLGENARAALVTRGLAEIGRLVAALGGRAGTVAGLAGLGDLMLTCAGARSRNYRFGYALGEGARADSAMPEETVEGRDTAAALVRRAGGLDVPVCRAVADLIAGAAVAEVVAALLGRPLRDE